METDPRRGEPPLAGLRVLDLTHYIAGPYATLLLAQLGADVVKVERPGHGDAHRSHGPVIRNQQGGEARTDFVHMNRNKRSLGLNLASEAGRELFSRLAATADLVVENFRPSVMDRMGLGWSRLHDLNPRLIYAAISGFGHLDLAPSPYAERPAFNTIAQAMSGIAEITGAAGGPPITTAVAIGDYVPALYTVIGILAAIEHRNRTGEGQLVDVAMYDALIPLNVRSLLKYETTGEIQTRGDEILNSAVGLVRVSDGYVSFSAFGNDMWRRTCEAIGQPQLADDPRFDSDRKRGTGWESDVKPVLEEWAAGRTKAEVAEILLRHQVPVGPVNNARDIIEDPHLEARRMLVEVGDMIGGTVKVPNHPVRFSSIHDVPPREARGLGADNQAVLADYLGLGADEVERLQAAGAIGTD